MTDENILESIKKFLIENVASKFKLEKPPKNEDIDEPFELVNPAVYVGWMPPKRHIEEGFFYNNNIEKYLEQYGHNIPSLIVCLGENGGEDDGEKTTLPIKIAIVTYDPGITDEGLTVPNYKGYKDLLNIITRVRLELSNSSNFDSACLEKPIRWGVFEEQSYPYWHGWITFNVTTMPFNSENKNINQFL